MRIGIRNEILQLRSQICMSISFNYPFPKQAFFNPVLEQKSLTRTSKHTEAFFKATRKLKLPSKEQQERGPLCVSGLALYVCSLFLLSYLSIFLKAKFNDYVPAYCARE